MRIDKSAGEVDPSGRTKRIVQAGDRFFERGDAEEFPVRHMGRDGRVFPRQQQKFPADAVGNAILRQFSAGRGGVFPAQTSEEIVFAEETADFRCEPGEEFF